MIKAILSGILAALLVIGDAAFAKGDSDHDYPEARLYDVSENAMGDVDAALARASENDKRVLIAFGANWCHDSRAFAGWTQSERIGTMIQERYELVFVNVGMPQSGDGHNQDILQRFGIAEQEGTPLVLALTAEGEVLNADTAQSWRNTASRSEDAIYDELVMLAEMRDDSPVSAEKVVQQIWTRGTNESCEYAASEEGPWVQSLEQLGQIGSETQPAEFTGDPPWRCVAGGIFALQSSDGIEAFFKTSNGREIFTTTVPDS